MSVQRSTDKSVSETGQIGIACADRLQPRSLHLHRPGEYDKAIVGLDPNQTIFIGQTDAFSHR